MPSSLLTNSEVLAGYDAVSGLYPHIPPLSMWRAFEVAAYRRHPLSEPVLDVGCGDGRFFRLVFPNIQRVVGVDHDPAAAQAARRGEVYQSLCVAPADQIPLAEQSFASAFANCSLEHMSNLPGVLAEIYRLLRPGGSFLFSVVTDRFLSWNPLPLLAGAIGGGAAARQVTENHVAHHHLVNPLPMERWISHLTDAGFEQIESIAIMPEICSRVFLFLDALWHVRPKTDGADEEAGKALEAYFAQIPTFAGNFRDIYAALLKMELNPGIGSGVVLAARRPDQRGKAS